MLERGGVGRQERLGIREGRAWLYMEGIVDRCLILMILTDGRDLEFVTVTVYGVASSGKGAT